MLSAMDFRPGVTFKWEGVIYEVVQFQHVQRPRLAPLVRAKIRNFKLGTITERTFSPDDKFDEVQLEQRNLQFSYKQDDTYFFMDTENYEQYEFSKMQIGDSVKFLVEEMIISMMIFEGEVLGIKVPNKADLKVIEAPPGIKGDSGGSVNKPVVLESGAIVNVPLFIKEGDVIKVDTRTGEYIERIKSE
jgi:elongation factor P